MLLTDFPFSKNVLFKFKKKDLCILVIQNIVQNLENVFGKK